MEWIQMRRGVRRNWKSKGRRNCDQDIVYEETVYFNKRNNNNKLSPNDYIEQFQNICYNEMQQDRTMEIVSYI